MPVRPPAGLSALSLPARRLAHLQPIRQHAHLRPAGGRIFDRRDLRAGLTGKGSSLFVISACLWVKISVKKDGYD